jgi:hypothetical protein
VRRALWETLAELVEAAGPDQDAGALRITGVDLDLPVEVRARPADDGWELLGDLPRWRWRGGFDERPARLRLRCVEGGQP